MSAVNKQINDKERIAAAMENPNLREIVEQCVAEPDDWRRTPPHLLNAILFNLLSLCFQCPKAWEGYLHDSIASVWNQLENNCEDLADCSIMFREEGLVSQVSIELWWQYGKIGSWCKMSADCWLYHVDSFVVILQQLFPYSYC